MVRRKFPLAILAIAFFLPAPLLRGATTEKSAKTPPKEDFYELYKVLADTVDEVDRNYVKEIDRRELIEAAIKGMMTRLDPYSTYIGPRELNQFRTNVESEFGGIGIHVSTEEGDLRVLSPIYGSPAYHAGIQAGDRIVEINGKSTEGDLPDEAIEQMKGKEGTTVALTIVHAGKTERQKITLRRERIRVETVLGDRRKANDTWDFMFDKPKKIGYIRVRAFSRETATELKGALKELKGQQLRGLILDLRFNPGGLLSSAIEVCNLFISEGRIVSTKGRNTPERVWDAHKGVAFEGFPMVVLVNRYSASASEIVSACLQDHKRAVILGQRTWGKGSVQNIIELEDGHSALKLTTASYRRPSGKNIHRFPNSKDNDEWGVKPDEGYEISLSDRETSSMLTERREKDIIRPSGAVAAKTEPAKKPADTKSADVKPADTKQTAKAGTPGAVKPKPESTIAKKPFVDRQLDAAMKYLGDELARAK